MINFRGMDLPKYAKISTRPRVSLIPPVSQDVIQIPGRAGSYDFGNSFGNRSIEVDFFIASTDKADLQKKVREFAKWIYTEDPQPLVILDEPDKQYFAKITGDTELKRLAHTGSGTITFICNNPFAYSIEQKVIDFNPVDTDPIIITNEGQIDAFPVIDMEFTNSTTEFAIVGDDQYMYLGQPSPVDDSTPVPSRTKVLEDDCSSVAGYTAGIVVDGGNIAGTLMSDGTKIRQASNDYGTGTKWHGAAGVKTIGQQLQDFSVQIEVGFKSGYPYQVGRMELYLLDINNSVIGKIAMVDASTGVDSPIVEARAGNFSTGKFFTPTTFPKGRFSQWNGPLRISRIGQKWEFSCSRRRLDGRLYDSFTTTFYDVNNQFQQKLAGFQVHFGAFSNYQPVSSNYIENISVWSENALDPIEIPYIFEEGDRLTIDSMRGTLFKNGEIFYLVIGDLGSTFIKLKPGENNLSVTPAIIQNGKITFREGWL